MILPRRPTQVRHELLLLPPNVLDAQLALLHAKPDLLPVRRGLRPLLPPDALEPLTLRLFLLDPRALRLHALLLLLGLGGELGGPLLPLRVELLVPLPSAIGPGILPLLESRVHVWVGVVVGSRISGLCREGSHRSNPGPARLRRQDQRALRHPPDEHHRHFFPPTAEPVSTQDVCAYLRLAKQRSPAPRGSERSDTAAWDRR